MNRFLFNQVKKIIPKISETELTALRSGGVHIDREIFSGAVSLKKLLQDKPATPSPKEIQFIQEKTEKMLRDWGGKMNYPGPDAHNVLKRLGRDGFLSMIIPEKYGGNPLSFATQTKILTKTSSFDPALGVVVMVPNSLGPAELLHHYGTHEQKQKYLGRLARGDLIPCFALTGPHNGSDATGNIDQGVVKIANGRKYIEVELNKRYITLAPVANLIGVAFQLKDPNHLLKSPAREGITVALLQRYHPGLKQTTHHDPNGAGFPNGTVRGKIVIDLKDIIGGEEKAGHGWKMLMECLAVGRGISLPSSANGTIKACTFGIFHYIQHRKQFKLAIGDMEGVQEKFVEMYHHSLVVNAAVHYIAHVLDQKNTPSVLTAIMKQQTTERARRVMTLGMDIYAGSAICVGKNNFFSKYYQSAPIGITVEGSNTLTRSLIIFGQGLNKSHPHIYNIFQAIQKDDVPDFGIHFWKMLGDVISVYLRSILPPRGDGLQELTSKFSNLCNFVALFGGQIKSRQMISGAMSDILSNLFLAYAVRWYCHHYLSSTNAKKVEAFVVENLCREASEKINLVIDNYPNNVLLLATRPKKYPVDFKKITGIYKIIKDDKCMIHDLKKDLYSRGTVIEDLERLSGLSPDSDEYKELYNRVIQVGEYEIKQSDVHCRHEGDI